MIRAVGQAKKGVRIVLDYAPSDGGTTLFVDGVAQGQPMAGEAFFQALLRIWLGDRPGAGRSQGSASRQLSWRCAMRVAVAFAATGAARRSTAARKSRACKIDDKTRVANAELALNGAGLRKRAFFKVYAIGLYVPQKNANAAALIEQPGPKRVAIHMLRDVERRRVHRGARRRHPRQPLRGRSESARAARQGARRDHGAR